MDLTDFLIAAKISKDFLTPCPGIPMTPWNTARGNKWSLVWQRYNNFYENAHDMH